MDVGLGRRRGQSGACHCRTPASSCPWVSGGPGIHAACRVWLRLWLFTFTSQLKDGGAPHAGTWEVQGAGPGSPVPHLLALGPLERSCSGGWRCHLPAQSAPQSMGEELSSFQSDTSLGTSQTRQVTFFFSEVKAV